MGFFRQTGSSASEKIGATVVAAYRTEYEVAANLFCRMTEQSPTTAVNKIRVIWRILSASWIPQQPVQWRKSNPGYFVPSALNL